MAEPDNIVREHLRAIRGELGIMHQDIRDLVVRVGNVETGLASGLAQVNRVVAEQSLRIDRLADRVERIERRLELITPAGAGI